MNDEGGLSEVAEMTAWWEIAGSRARPDSDPTHDNLNYVNLEGGRGFRGATVDVHPGAPAVGRRAGGDHSR